MIKIKQTVIVEGRYDKARLSSLIDANIITTDGFGVFKDKEKQRLIRRLADKNGLVIITDSDSAGFKIRSFLKGFVDNDRIINVYVPDIYGKERRKAQHSKEGKIGVEGMPTHVLMEAFEKAGVFCTQSDEETRAVTVSDLYDDGLCGKENSAGKRAVMLKSLDLPERLSTAAFLKIINTFLTFDEYKQLVASVASSVVE